MIHHGVCDVWVDDFSERFHSATCRVPAPLTGPPRSGWLPKGTYTLTIVGHMPIDRGLLSGHPPGSLESRLTSDCHLSLPISNRNPPDWTE